MEPSERTGRRTVGRLPAYGPTGDGRHLLRLLALGGWEFDIQPGFAGRGVKVRAFLGPSGAPVRELFYEGRSVASVAVDLYEEAMAA